MKGLAIFWPFLPECLAFFAILLALFYWRFGQFWKNKSGNLAWGNMDCTMDTVNVLQGKCQQLNSVCLPSLLSFMEQATSTFNWTFMLFLGINIIWCFTIFSFETKQWEIFYNHLSHSKEKHRTLTSFMAFVVIAGSGVVGYCRGPY